MRVLAWYAYKNKNVNPYNYLLYTNVMQHGQVQVEEFSPRKILTGNYNVWHLHWPELQLNRKSALVALYRVVILFLLLNIAKLRGMGVVWTAHNHSSHEKLHPRLEILFWNYFLSRLDAVIHLSNTGRFQFEQKFGVLPGVKSFVIPHGNYVGIYENRITRMEAREKLGLSSDAFVVLFIGQIRPYKNVTKLIKEFGTLESKKRFLIVAGKPLKETLSAEILSAAEGHSNIILRLEFIPDNDLQLYLNSADLVVLPYQDIQNSGSALLALSFATPLLVPEKGAMSELQEMIGSEWVMTYTGELTQSTLETSFKWVKNQHRDELPNLNATDWDLIALKTIKVYEQIAI